jgi:hypothetical protein
MVSCLQDGKRKNMNRIFVKDGDTISVIAELDPSAFDPALNYPGVGQAFRVIANSFSPMLMLVPLTNEPALLTDLPRKE